MSWPDLRRARQFGHSSSTWRAVLLLSLLSATLVTLLIIDLGLIMQLLVHRGSSETATDWILGPIVSGRLVEWPLTGEYETCLLLLVGIGCGAAFLEALCRWLLHRAVHRMAIRVTTRIRAAIQDQAFLLGTHDLLGTAKASPEELFSDKAETLRRGLVAWYQASPRSWIALGLFLMVAVAVNFWMGLFAVLLSIYIIRMYRGLKRRTEYNRQRWHELAGRHEVKLLRVLNLAPMTTGYGLETPPGESFVDLLNDFETSEWRAATSSSGVRPILNFTILLAAGFLLLVVGLRDDLTISGTVLLGAALISAYFPATRLFGLRQTLDPANQAAHEILAYLDREQGVTEVDQARPLNRLQQNLHLDRITLADRNGHRLLDTISLDIPAGHRVAILASDPQTPIALAGLFVRFYDPAAGRILYDGHDIRKATLDTIRGQALLVAAHGPLFPGTVFENIACGDSGFTTLQVTDAARRAQAYDFVQALPQQFSTRIGDHPPLLTPDQAFRVGLARALLREPSLLVIEEPAAGHFDEATNVELETAVEQAAEGRTLILLPSLPTSLRKADQVFVFHEGKLETQGKHADLLQHNELYRHLNYVLFNAFRQKIKW